MDYAQRSILAACMGITIKLTFEDQSIVNDIAYLNTFEKLPVDDATVTVMEEAIMRELQKPGKDPAFILGVIDYMKYLDVEYIKGMTELFALGDGVQEDAVRELLERPAPTFKRGRHVFGYYQVVTRLAITTGNTEIIALALERLQGASVASGD